MNTEITETNGRWIFYDGDCRLCRSCVAWLYRPLRRRGFRFAALQAPWVRERLNLPADDSIAFREMRLRLPGGQIFGGGDAVIELSRAIWWAWPIFLMRYIPGGRQCVRAAYRRIAARRNCDHGACQVLRHPATHTPEQSKTSGFFELP